MNEVAEFFRKLVDASDFPPRWHCGKWTDFHGWLYIISDLMIWGAYFAIPAIILRYITRRQELRFQRIYILFAAFILACGTTHLLDAITFWYPAYRLNALVRFITGVVSWITVFQLVKLLPLAFSLKTSEQLEHEVAQRRKAEEQLKINNDILNEAQEIAKLGHWRWDVKNDKLTWSDTMRKIYGSDIDTDITYAHYTDRLHPDDKEYVENSIRNAFETRNFDQFYHRIVMPDGTVKTLHAKGEVVQDEQGEISYMIGTGQDVTEAKEVEQELLAKSQALEATNKELEKFASIASHDLREPLRKIITFAGMLEREYKDTLGDNGKSYIDKVVNSSARMQQMINDVLEFSSLSVDGNRFDRVNVGQVVAGVLSDLEILVKSSGANIEVGEMPEIEANVAQLGLLFQNLVTNAIKFAKTDTPPDIRINAEVVYGRDLTLQYGKIAGHRATVLYNPRFWDNEKFCRISVKDNGIGFEEVYLDKIFALFQRLHSKSRYEGTGIGLAICKKVVDIHHGMITAHSKPGQGAEFVITLPLSQRNFKNVSSSQV